MDQTNGQNVENTNVEAGNENPTVETPTTEPGTTEENNAPPVETPIDAQSNEESTEQRTTETISQEEVGDLVSVIPSPEMVEEEAAPTEPELTPDEKIIDAWLQNGKTQVSTNELIQAGFEAKNIGQYNFTVGRFLLKRILLVSPYTIERADKN